MSKFNYVVFLGFLWVVFSNCNYNKSVKSKESMTLEEMQRLEKQEQEYLSQAAEKMKKQFTEMPFFPAQINQGENFYSVQITADVGAFYAKEFGKHGLYGNGYCWEGVVEQLIEKKQKELLSKINFDAEADTCFISCDNENSMKKLATFINSELSTKEKLRQAILSIDKSKLDC